ncbi:MAG TPA: hypothetical protein VFY93_12455 [Planctomycetota bacterium]|nr:hypothetical protein [Planctomycetota bacterium]
MRLLHKLRHRWEAFAGATGLRFLPPVGAAACVLAAGVLLPFVPRVDARPPQLAPSLAGARIARFARAHPDLPDLGPAGTILAARPAFYWPARPDAESYSFRLESSDGTVQASATGIRTTFQLILPPGRLKPGEYRFSVHAVLNGKETPWREGSFAIYDAGPQPDIQALLGSAETDLDAAESAYVLLGYYAERQSVHDVVSAFLQWKTARGEAASLGSGPPSVWLNALAHE